MIVIPEDPPSFNPAVADTGYDYLVMELVLLSLADVDPNGDVFPELAAELPTVENGGVVVNEDDWTMTVTWKMRQDVQWSDGKPVTADDVIFTYESIVDPELGAWIPGIVAPRKVARELSTGVSFAVTALGISSILVDLILKSAAGIIIPL